jgi:predicted nuclease with RNAse H fold
MSQSRYIISIDIGWKSEKFVAAILKERNLIKFLQGDNIGKLISLYKDKSALILLDIPIEGCEELSSLNPLRPVDRLLLKIGIPVLPSYLAKTKGKEIKQKLLKGIKKAKVIEMYPYAVLRFLFAASQRIPLFKLFRGSCSHIIDSEIWWNKWPPRYKRERKKEKKKEEFKKIYHLFSFLEFYACIPSPNNTKLSLLSHYYDAILGLVLGIQVNESSPWTSLLEVPNTKGKIQILADKWLKQVIKFHKSQICHP